MKLFLVWRWETEAKYPEIIDGMYAVRAANPEDCAQFLLRSKEKPTPGQDTTDMLKRIRESVAKAKTLNLQGKFKYEEIVDAFEKHWSDFI